MNIFTILLGAVSGILALSIMLIFILRKTTQLQLMSKIKVDERTFYAVRLEGEDFLFLKDKNSVKFVNTLEDEGEEFKVLNLYEIENRKEFETLEIPKHEKAS